MLCCSIYPLFAIAHVLGVNRVFQLSCASTTTTLGFRGNGMKRIPILLAILLLCCCRHGPYSNALDGSREIGWRESLLHKRRKREEHNSLHPTLQSSDLHHLNRSVGGMFPFFPTPFLPSAFMTSAHLRHQQEPGPEAPPPQHPRVPFGNAGGEMLSFPDNEVVKAVSSSSSSSKKRNMFHDYDILPPDAQTSSILLTSLRVPIERVLTQDLFSLPHYREKIPSLRPDGLSPLTLVLLQEYTLTIQFYFQCVKKKSAAFSGIKLSSNGAEALREDALSEADLRLFHQRLQGAGNNLMENHVSRVVSCVGVAQRKRYRIAMRLRVRVEGVCLFMKNPRVRSVHPADPLPAMVLVQFRGLVRPPRTTQTGQLALPRGPIPSQPTQWYPLMLSNAQQEPGNQRAGQYHPLLITWLHSFKQTTRATLPEPRKNMFPGLTRIDNMEKPVRDLLVDHAAVKHNESADLFVRIFGENYEATYLKFGYCQQSSVLNTALVQNINTAYHCVALPVSPSRILPNEAAILQCGNLYPVGTRLVYVEVYPGDSAQTFTKEFKTRQCTHEGWSASVVLSTEDGLKLHRWCQNLI